MAPAPGTPPAAVVAAFPHVVRLALTAGEQSSRQQHEAAADGGGADADAALPPLETLPQLRRLRALKLQALGAASGTLDCRVLLPLAQCRAFGELEAAALQLRHAEALGRLGQLSRLHLRAYSLSGCASLLPELLAPLRRLQHLRVTLLQPAGSAALAAVAAAGGADGGAGGGGTPPPGALAGLGRLSALVSLELSVPDAASDAACAEIAGGGLRNLARLALDRPPASAQRAPSVTDAGLAALAAGLADQLTSLSLTGHTALTDEGVSHLRRLRLLTHLELRPAAPAPHW